MAGDCHLAHRIGQFAVLDPETRGAAAVIAGHQVGAHADQVGHVEAVLDFADQLLWGLGACFEMKVGRCRRRRRRYAARRVTSRLEPEFSRGCGIEEPCFQHTVFDERERLTGDAFGIKRPRAKATLAQWIVNDADFRTEQFLGQAVFQEARLARDRCAIDRRGQRSDQCVRDTRIEHHRHAPRLDLARIEPLHRTLTRKLADLLGRFEVARMQHRGEIVVALHGGAVTGNRHHRHRVMRADVSAAKAMTRDQHHSADSGRCAGTA